MNKKSANGLIDHLRLLKAAFQNAAKALRVLLASRPDAAMVKDSEHRSPLDVAAISGAFQAALVPNQTKKKKPKSQKKGGAA
jgi:hypothetical protein